MKNLNLIKFKIKKNSMNKLNKKKSELKLKRINEEIAESVTFNLKKFEPGTSEESKSSCLFMKFETKEKRIEERL